jgi:hypothetical protein
MRRILLLTALLIIGGSLAFYFTRKSTPQSEIAHEEVQPHEPANPTPSNSVVSTKAASRNGTKIPDHSRSETEAQNSPEVTPASQSHSDNTAQTSQTQNTNLSSDGNSSASAIPEGPHFAHVQHYLFNPERIHTGKTETKADDPALLQSIKGSFIGALTFADDRYAKIDFQFQPDALISFVVNDGKKDLISFKKAGKISELSYLGQDNVPSVGEVTVLSLRVSKTETFSFAFPVGDTRKFEGIYFRNGERAGTFYLYRQDQTWP